MLKHVVLLKFERGAPSGRAEIEKGLGELPDIIPEIMEFQFGREAARCAAEDRRFRAGVGVRKS